MAPRACGGGSRPRFRYAYQELVGQPRRVLRDLIRLAQDVLCAFVERGNTLT
jgi:hypothetical protein